MSPLFTLNFTSGNPPLFLLRWHYHHTPHSASVSSSALTLSRPLISGGPLFGDTRV